MAGGFAGIIESAHLFGDLGQIDRHLLARNRDFHLDGDWLADVDAVVVHIGCGFIDPVGNVPRAGAGRALRLFHDMANSGERFHAAITRQQFAKASLACCDGGDLRAQIAHGSVGIPDIHADDLDEVLVDHARLLILHDGDLDPLGIDIGGDAAERAAHIWPMGHAAGEGAQFAFKEDWLAESEMVQMTAREIGVVGDEDVAGLDIVAAKMTDLRAHRL